MLSRIWILILGVGLMLVFQLLKFILSKFANSFYEKAKKFFPLVIFILCFIVLVIVYVVKFHNHNIADSLIDSLCVTAIAVFGYDLIEPLVKSIAKKN